MSVKNISVRPLLLTVLITAIIVVSFASLVPVASAQGDPPVGRFDVGGYSLYMECLGQVQEGVPPVIMTHEYASDARSYLLIAPRLAEITQVCMVDRANAGGSDAIDTPRTGEAVVGEMAALLEAAGVPAPYVMVGFGWGGLYSRLFAAQYPDQVSGMVLIDADHEDRIDILQSIGAPDIWSSAEGMTIEDRDATFVQVREVVPAQSDTTPLGDLPLIVLAANEMELVTAQPIEEAMEHHLIWLELQQELATLSTNSVYILAQHSTHAIHVENPDLVIDAVTAVIDAAVNNFPLFFVDTQSEDEYAEQTIAPTPTPAPVSDPAFLRGSYVTIPTEGFAYQIKAEAGGLLPAGFCELGSIAIVERTVLAVDGQRWLELDCGGVMGWAPEADFIE